MDSQDDQNRQKGIHFIYKFGVLVEDQQRTGDEMLQRCRCAYLCVLRMVTCLTLRFIYKAECSELRKHRKSYLI